METSRPSVTPTFTKEEIVGKLNTTIDLYRKNEIKKAHVHICHILHGMDDFPDIAYFYALILFKENGYGYLEAIHNNFHYGLLHLCSETQLNEEEKKCMMKTLMRFTLGNLSSQLAAEKKADAAKKIQKINTDFFRSVSRLEKKGEFVKAGELYDFALRHSQFDEKNQLRCRECLLETATQLEKKPDPAEAANYYRRAIQLYPLDHRLIYKLINILNYGDKNKNNYHYYYLIWRSAVILTGDIETILQRLEEEKEKNRQDPDVWVELLHYYVMAVAVFHRQNNIVKKQDYLRRAVQCFNQFDNAQAAEELRKAYHALHDEVKREIERLRSLLHEEQKTENAKLSTLPTVQKHTPEPAKSLNEAHKLYEKHQYAEAVNTLIPAFNFAFDMPDMLFLTGLCAWQKGNHQYARLFFSEGIVRGVPRTQLTEETQTQIMRFLVFSEQTDVFQAYDHKLADRLMKDAQTFQEQKDFVTAARVYKECYDSFPFIRDALTAQRLNPLVEAAVQLQEQKDYLTASQIRRWLHSVLPYSITPAQFLELTGQLAQHAALVKQNQILGKADLLKMQRIYKELLFWLPLQEPYYRSYALVSSLLNNLSQDEVEDETTDEIELDEKLLHAIPNWLRAIQKQDASARPQYPEKDNAEQLKHLSRHANDLYGVWILSSPNPAPVQSLNGTELLPHLKQLLTDAELAELAGHALFTQVREQNPLEQARAKIARAKVMYEQNNISEAMQLLETLESSGVRHPDILFLRGLCCIRSANYSVAYDHFLNGMQYFDPDTQLDIGDRHFIILALLGWFEKPNDAVFEQTYENCKQAAAACEKKGDYYAASRAHRAALIVSPQRYKIALQEQRLTLLSGLGKKLDAALEKQPAHAARICKEILYWNPSNHRYLHLLNCFFHVLNGQVLEEAELRLDAEQSKRVLAWLVAVQEAKPWPQIIDKYLQLARTRNSPEYYSFSINFCTAAMFYNTNSNVQKEAMHYLIYAQQIIREYKNRLAHDVAFQAAYAALSTPEKKELDVSTSSEHMPHISDISELVSDRSSQAQQLALQIAQKQEDQNATLRHEQKLEETRQNLENELKATRAHQEILQMQLNAARMANATAQRTALAKQKAEFATQLAAATREKAALALQVSHIAKERVALAKQNVAIAKQKIKLAKQAEKAAKQTAAAAQLKITEIQQQMRSREADLKAKNKADTKYLKKLEGRLVLLANAIDANRKAEQAVHVLREKEQQLHVHEEKLKTVQDAEQKFQQAKQNVQQAEQHVQAEQLSTLRILIKVQQAKQKLENEVQEKQADELAIAKLQHTFLAPNDRPVAAFVIQPDAHPALHKAGLAILQLQEKLREPIFVVNAAPRCVVAAEKSDLNLDIEAVTFNTCQEVECIAQSRRDVVFMKSPNRDYSIVRIMLPMQYEEKSGAISKHIDIRLTHSSALRHGLLKDAKKRPLTREAVYFEFFMEQGELTARAYDPTACGLLHIQFGVLKLTVEDEKCFGAERDKLIYRTFTKEPLWILHVIYYALKENQPILYDDIIKQVIRNNPRLFHDIPATLLQDWIGKFRELLPQLSPAAQAPLLDLGIYHAWPEPLREELLYPPLRRQPHLILHFIEQTIEKNNAVLEHCGPLIQRLAAEKKAELFAPGHVNRGELNMYLTRAQRSPNMALYKTLYKNYGIFDCLSKEDKERFGSPQADSAARLQPAALTRSPH